MRKQNILQCAISKHACSMLSELDIEHDNSITYEILILLPVSCFGVFKPIIISIIYKDNTINNTITIYVIIMLNQQITTVELILF